MTEENEDQPGFQEWSDAFDQANAEAMFEYYALKVEFDYQERILVSVPHDTTWHSAKEFVSRHAPAFARTNRLSQFDE